MRKFSYWLFSIAILFSSCHDTTVTPYVGTIPVTDVRTVSAMTNEFGWNLFKTIAKETSGENILISPISVQIVLSMAANGANGRTVEEILDVLGCAGCEIKGLNEQTAQLRELMEEQSGSPRLISANGFFYDPQKLQLLDLFEQNLANSYRAEIQSLDFKDPATLSLINDWVKGNTEGKIEEIIDKIEPDDLAFIINALHFKADWSNGFRTTSIYADTFFNAGQNAVIVNYLNQDWYYSFAGNENFNMVDLVFKDSTYTISLIQPIGNLANESNWISGLSSETISGLWQSLAKARINLTLPKFEIDYEIDLINPLKQMGITSAFLPGKADFSNLGTAFGDMYIRQAKHKAILKIDENGAEGGAVTALGITFTSAPPDITFDRPFSIVLRHKETNTILFAGLINDPSL